MLNDSASEVQIRAHFTLFEIRFICWVSFLFTALFLQSHIGSQSPRPISAIIHNHYAIIMPHRNLGHSAMKQHDWVQKH